MPIGTGRNDILDASATTQGVVLSGGEGNDTLIGGSGDDRFMAGLGSDTINDGAHGAEGDAVSFHFAGSRVILDLTAGNASWTEGAISHTTTLSNIENVRGSLWDDTLTGDAGNNRIDGGGGNDVLNGKSGNDFLFGGDGDDVILFVCGEGNDTVRGGAGHDTLKLFDTGGGTQGNWSIQWNANNTAATATEGGNTIWSMTLSSSATIDANGNASLASGTEGVVVFDDGASQVTFDEVGTVEWYH